MADYNYPSAYQIYPDTPQKSYRLKRLRFWLRSRLHQKQINLFTQFVNQNPSLIPLLNQRANYSYPLVHRFLDKRFNATQRFQAICDNLTFLPHALSQYQLPPLWEKSISFGEITPDFELRLNINEHQPMEGFWALELYQKSSQQLVYLLTFGLVENALLIGVIQGSNQANAKELMKQLTKQCHGLRPAHLMVESMKLLASVLGYNQLLGIPHKYQNKSRFIQSKRYVVDYDAIFSESGGILKDYWQMSVIMDKSLERIPSKKRSMYRKRFALLEQIEINIRTAFGINT
ncbi:VirK/YbjX family protein [Actinobacillus equuli]|uniref:VirK/YbjX family protein n=1 Tax=Actinobacillus equuli TaxID=718 RepID=UPI0024411EE1|nr:VirK/YbjX family protein [Actinobacillus equuli]WGE57692.1 VirK/YbjX family protein [Actinobacillus equuli subsp. equuli]